jgi:hypothetical protein
MPAGWVLHLAEVGHSPEPHPGLDLSQWAGYKNVVRIQHAWGEGAGTIPPPRHLDGYILRVVSLVANTPHCHRWIIGNEPDHSQERPDFKLITPRYYAEVYALCYAMIHTLPGHADDEVVLAPIAPWNTESGMGWIEYFERVISLLLHIDAIAIHTYSRGADPASISSEDKMGAPYQMYYNSFKAYQDWMDAIPARLRDVPVYVTETNQIAPWLNEPNSWIQTMYREIDDWNSLGGQAIHCAILYRWPKYDKWYIKDLGHVHDDFRKAQEYGYSLPINENGGNEMIVNPGFEAGFRAVGGDGRLTVGNAWLPGWDNSYGVQPEFQAEPKFIGNKPGHVRNGSFAQKWFTTFEKHRAWVRQEITGLTPDEIYRFSAYVWVWSSEHNHDGTKSEPPTGKVWVRVGVNPWGDADAMTPSTQYGYTYVAQYDKWLELEVIFRAIKDRAVVFLWSQPEHEVRHNDVYWDDAAIELLAAGDPGPEPPDPEPPDPPTLGDCPTLEEIRGVVREELDKTSGTWAARE